MGQIKFEWDAKNSRTNKKKHSVTFDEAETIFADENALLIHDPDHSDDEDRFVLLGLSVKFRMLVVCHCYRSADTIIRIISARKADKDEEKQYRERWKR
jgi:hypothetical protein